MSIIVLNNCNFGCVLKGHILQGASQLIECTVCGTISKYQVDLQLSISLSQ